MTDDDIINDYREEIEKPKYLTVGIFWNVLDLINRQKAKIERLKDLCGDCSMLKGEIETISELEEQIEYWQRGYNDLIQELKTAKSEARKEFAERLKENTVTVKIGKQTCKVITVEGIDNLFLDFTKMVGGD